jgi:hypothetical protein
MFMSFDPTLAKKIGLNAAVIVHHLYQKQGNSVHLSLNSLHQELNFLSKWDIRKALTVLQEKEILIKSNAPKNKYHAADCFSFNQNCSLFSCVNLTPLVCNSHNHGTFPTESGQILTKRLCESHTIGV